MAITPLCFLLIVFAISSVDGECKDMIPNCADYEDDTCFTYKKWSTLNCPKRCKLCTGSGDCPTGWYYSQSDHTCFKIHAKYPKNWNDAQDHCKKDGGSLVIIKDDKKDSFLHGLLESEEDEEFWIGLENVNSKGMKFKWVDGSSLTTYTNWNTNQPDNYEGKEHCVALIPVYEGWSDIGCLGKHPFICQTNVT